MPENYITIAADKGSVNISEDVIAAIAASAIAETEGIAGFSTAAGTELGELIGKKSAAKGIRVSFAEDTVQIDVTVMAQFGTAITALGEKVQAAAAAAVESMTGLKSVVNVCVAGVVFEK